MNKKEIFYSDYDYLFLKTAEVSFYFVVIIVGQRIFPVDEEKILWVQSW